MIVLFIRSSAIQTKKAHCCTNKKLSFPKARSKFATPVQTKKYPEDGTPRDISLFYVRLVLLYRKITQYIRTKMKRLACNGMSGYSTIYPNPNKKNYPKGSDSSVMVECL